MNPVWLSSAQIDAQWYELGPYLERFERETQLASAEVIRAACLKGDKQLWAIHDHMICGVVVTQVLESPKGRVCEVYAACGACSREGIREVYVHLQLWAAEAGCKFIRTYGRKGWKRVLPKFRQVGVILEQEL